MHVTITLPESADRAAVFGAAERHLKLVREALGVSIAARGSEVRIDGETHAVLAARRVVDRLIEAAARNRPLGRRQVLDELAGATWAVERGGAQDVEGDEQPLWTGRLAVQSGGRAITPCSENQQAYLDAMFEADLVFGIGPAGTGKTYLAVAAAIHMLRVGRVKRAILVRPAVEAGEKLGFLPGDQFQKVNPYLRPLLDALNDMLDYDTIKRFMSSEIVEVVPLAFMRGRTLNDAIIILDEAQNTTRGQMQMFLTRMGQRSRMIVTGDPTQTDLEDPAESGLVDAGRRLRRVPGVRFCVLDRTDVVRHSLVQRIIEAYGGPEGRAQTGPGWLDAPEHVVAHAAARDDEGEVSDA